MSILGPANLPAIGLAGSAAASQQRAPGLVDRDKADQALQKLQQDQVRLADRDLDDSVETDFSHGQVSDRDSDGRLPWQRPGAGGQEAETDSGEHADGPPQHPHPPDPQNERGRTLDVDA